MCSQNMEVKMLTEKCKVERTIVIWTYFPNLRSGLKASRFLCSVLYFCGSFVEFLISITTNLGDEKILRNLF